MQSYHMIEYDSSVTENYFEPVNDVASLLQIPSQENTIQNTYSLVPFRLLFQ